MERVRLRWARPPSGVRLRTRGGLSATIVEGATAAASAAARADAEAAALTEEVVRLLEAVQTAVDDLELRRQQSLGELQHVAVELAVAAASHLVFDAIEREQFAVDELVRQAITRMGLDEGITVSLHPDDLGMLQRKLADRPSPWSEGQVVLRGDPALARGGCRAESADGRILVSDVAARLSEIRRHWMEELDDAPIERRRTQAESGSLRRFPDRRETA